MMDKNILYNVIMVLIQWDDWQENWWLKKLVLVIDKDWVCSRSWLLEIDERNENVLVSF